MKKMDNPLWRRKTSVFKNRDFVTDPHFLELAEQAQKIDLALASLQSEIMTLHEALYKVTHPDSKRKDTKKIASTREKLDAAIQEDIAKSDDLVAQKNIIIEEIREQFAPEINGPNPASALSQFYQK
jgi:hypothetical protein